MNEFEREMWRWGLTCALAILLSYNPEAVAGASQGTLDPPAFVTIAPCSPPCP